MYRKLVLTTTLTVACLCCGEWTQAQFGGVQVRVGGYGSGVRGGGFSYGTGLNNGYGISYGYGSNYGNSYGYGNNYGNTTMAMVFRAAMAALSSQEAFIMARA